jgi:hypothetical protein
LVRSQVAKHIRERRQVRKDLEGRVGFKLKASFDIAWANGYSDAIDDVINGEIEL